METIKSSREISSLFNTGKRVNTPFFVLISKETQQHGQQGRVAFIAGKKSGNAVWRNAAKRRLRAICRDLNGPWEGFDVIFLAKAGILKPLYAKVLRVARRTLTESNIIRRETSNRVVRPYE